MSGPRPEPLIELFAELADLPGILCQLFLAPTIRDRTQERDQSRWSGEDDPLLDSDLDQAWVLFERGAEERFSGKEEDDEFRRRLQVLPVRLGA